MEPFNLVTSDNSQTDPWFQPADDRQQSFSSLNEAITGLGCSPLKVAKLNESQLQKYTKKKVEQAKLKLDDLSNEPSTSQAASEPAPHLTCSECDDYKTLISECKSASKPEQIQILTLAPTSWTIDKTAREFNVTNYVVGKARALKQSKGILAYPLKKVGHGISGEIKQNVTNFFESDEISRMCPGMKDFVPVRIDGEKVHKQKRLILCNLDEAYQAFKAKHPCKIGFSKFCELRPKWCITVGARGTHSVCVCTQQQNVKLMSACLGHEVTYHTLIQKLVCEETNKTCMLHRCNNCPGEAGLLAFLETLMAPELEAEESIQFKQWVHTDRTSLITQEETCSNFIDTLIAKTDELSETSFSSSISGSFFESS